MSSYTVEFYDFNRNERTMTGPSWERTQHALSPLDAVIKAAGLVEPEVTEISCSDEDVIASAYAIGPCEFEFHLYVGDTDTAFTLPE